MLRTGTCLVLSLFLFATAVHAQEADAIKADALMAEIEALDKDLTAKQEAVADAEDKAAAEAARDAAQTAFDAKVAELQVAVKAIEDAGGDATKYKTFLTEFAGLSLDNLDASVAIGLVQKWFDKAKKWFVEDGPGVLFKIILFFLILFAARVIGNILGGIASRALNASKLKVSDLLKAFFVNVVTKTVFLVGLIIALGTIGINTGPLLAGVGVLGFVVGFALQDTLANFAAGIMILLYRPYDVGDLVETGGVMGKVESMTLVSTSIVTLDNQMVVVPNGAIWGNVITNITAMPIRRCDLVIGVGYSDDLGRAQQIMLDAIKTVPTALADPAPVVRTCNLGESSVDFVVRPWCNTSDYWDCYWTTVEACKNALDKAGLNIPFPQRDLHIVSGLEKMAT
ncbi:MAG: mechanosensitive ion channel family protein [Planctomycetota bacterium]|nr:mechanosensitive ion channel family protein [Planctomycetota bacterium]